LVPSITRKPTSLKLDIYLKSSATNTTISFLSNHAIEHKLAAYNFFINRKLSLPLSNVPRLKEWENIKKICTEQQYPYPPSDKNETQYTTENQSTIPTTTPVGNTKLATFKYTSPRI
jgi:hypothetical protein